MEGLKKTIKKFKPNFLIEYNKEYFLKVSKKLKDYDKYIYDIQTNKMVKLNSKLIKFKVARTSANNPLSIRNIFFVHKKNSLLC